MLFLVAFGSFCFFLIPSNVQADSATLLQSTDSPANGATIAPTLDLTNNLYKIKFTGATWNPLTAFEAIGVTGVNGEKFWFRNVSSAVTLYMTHSFVDSNTWAGLFSLVSGTKYDLEMDIGLKHIRIFKDGVQVLSALPYRISSGGGSVTTQILDPVNTNKALISTNTAVDNISVYQRDKSQMSNLVLLGDSITLTSAFESRLSSQLGRDTLISNHSRGYRQSRELRNAILTNSPGDRYGAGTMYYPDVAGFYRSDMASNKVLIGVGTNDLLWSNNASGIGKGTPDGANTYGPEEGGYVAVDAQDGNEHNTINNILNAIDDIVSNNPGWKVYFRTPLNTNGYMISGSAAYNAGEAKRQAIRTSALSGLIKQKIEATGGIVIDQDNIFAPAASRTDGVNANGAAYNASYWPASASSTGYSNNTTYFAGDKIHPNTAGYNAIADYVATMLVDTTAPVISSIATSTTGTTATINWTTNERATSTIRYGLTTAYGATSTSATATTTHSVTLTGLTSETTYHFQILVSDSSNNLATSSDLVLTTPDVTAPTISDIATSTTQTTATITWTTNEAATTTIDYGLTTSYGASSSNAVATTSHVYVISDLTASTIYNFRISSWDSSGNLATSSNGTFNTSAYPVTNTTISPGGYSGGGSVSSAYWNGINFVQNNLQTCTTGALFNILTGSPCSQSSTLITDTKGRSVTAEALILSGIPKAYRFVSKYNIKLIGDEARHLQMFLNRAGYTVANKGNGSQGLEIKSFGPATRAALAKYQKDNGIKPAVGNFGPTTRAYINSIFDKLGL